MSKLENSIAGLYMMVIMQFGFRILTFGFNLLITRLLTLDTIGNLHDYELLTTSLLLLSRETLRMTLTRNAAADSLQLQINYSYLSWLIYAIALPFLWKGTVRNIYLLGVAVELLSEPMYIFVSSKVLYHIRAKAESSAFLAQNICVLLLCLSAAKNGVIQHDFAVLVYASGQVVFGGVLFLAYLWQISSICPLKELLPRRVLHNGRYEWHSQYYNSIAISFLAQTVLKYVLTVGDKLTSVALNISVHNKGAFKVVSDLGSLVARVIFAPLEEVSRLYFSKTLTSSEDIRPRANETASILRALVQFQIIFGSFFIFLGSNFTDILLSILFNKNTPENARLLSWYCVYIPILGINGILEAFLQGVGSSTVLKSQSLLMMVLWGAYVTLAFSFIRIFGLGSLGLIISNIITMSCRIIFAYSYVLDFYADIGKVNGGCETLVQNLQIRQLLPGSKKTWSFFFLGWIITLFTAELTYFYRLCIGFNFSLILVLDLYSSEYMRVRTEIQSLFGKKSEKDKKD